MKIAKYFLSIFLLIFLIINCKQQTTKIKNDTVPSTDEIITYIQESGQYTWPMQTRDFDRKSLKLYKNEHALTECIRDIYRKNPQTKPYEALIELKKLAELGKIKKLYDIERKYDIKKYHIEKTIRIFAEALQDIMQNKKVYLRKMTMKDLLMNNYKQ